MTERKFASYYPICYRLFFAALLTGIVMESVGYLVGIPMVGKWNWILMGLSLLLVSGMNYAKTGVRIICGIVLVFGVLIMIPLWKAGQVTAFFHDYVYWLFQSGEYNSQWKQGYQLVQTVWVTLGCFCFQTLTENKPRMKDLTALVLVVGLVFFLFGEERIPSVGFAFIVGYLLLWYVEFIRKGWKKKKQRDIKEYTLFLLPYFVMFMLLLTCLPYSEEPYGWTTARMVWGRIYDEVTTWWEKISRGDIDDFGRTVVGFSENGKLLGSFTREDKKLMTISGDIGLRTNLYLRGKTYDTFDGREWLKNVEENIGEYPLDTLETIYAIRRFDDKLQANYIRADNAMVRYDFFNTEVLFTPLKLAKVKYDSYDIVGRDFTLREMNGYGTEYGLRYYQLNLETPEFQKLLEAELAEDDKLWINVTKTSGTLRNKEYTLEDLFRYRERMREEYFKEITLSDELQEYVDTVTLGCETKYQKLKAMEKALSEYIYTRSPGKLPGRIQSQEDFLEYLLLESKEGYCVHYATAFVLLARAEGMPARYVEGFCVPISESKVMEVYSGWAHAWPEVYFEGVGWIGFEPTPGYAEIFYDGWEIKKLETEETEKEEEEEEEEVSETPPPQQENWKEIEEEIAVREQAMKKAKDRQRLGLLLRSMGGIVLVCLSVLFAERAVRKGRYRRMSTEGKFEVEVRRNLWLFARLGYKREEAETLSELQDRIRQDIPELFENKRELVFFKGYEEYLYRLNEISLPVLNEAIRERQEILLLIKNESPWQYHMLRLRMWFSMIW